MALSISDDKLTFHQLITAINDVQQLKVNKYKTEGSQQSSVLDNLHANTYTAINIKSLMCYLH